MRAFSRLISTRRCSGPQKPPKQAKPNNYSLAFPNQKPVNFTDMTKAKSVLEPDPTVPPDFSKHELVLLDESDERSLVNIVPPKFREAIQNLANNFPEYLEETELDLQRIVKPTPLDDRLRVAFWHEYTAAQDLGRDIKLANVFSNYCSDFYFYSKFITRPEKVAWIICRPANYMQSLEASLNNGKNRLDELMRMELFHPNGMLKVEETKLFLKAYKMLDDRVKGSVIQRIEKKTQHIPFDDEPDKLKKELLELRKKQGAIDVTPKPEGS